jgi:putative phage-type endonuclease
LASGICKFQPFLSIKGVRQALDSLNSRFGRIPPLKIVNNAPDIPYKKETFTEEQWKLFKHYESVIEHLKSIPQDPQKSVAWLRKRMNMITGSDAATSVQEHFKHYGESCGEQQYKFILKKCGLDDGFKGNQFTYHGNKYEDVAILIYEKRYDVITEAYGLIPDQDGRVIGASPDGICSNRRRSGGYSPRVGRMVEIKCTCTRKIKTEGVVDGGICPHYYWVQVQQQLQCCGLDKCDFWQCEIKELPEQEWRREIGKGGLSVLTGMEMGSIIELAPREKTRAGEFCRYESLHLYPPRADMSAAELDEWISGMCKRIKGGLLGHQIARINAETRGETPDDNKANDTMYDFSRILHWRLDKAHNELIVRDDEYFAKAYQKMVHTWEIVKFFRAHPDIFDTWHKYSKTKKCMTNAEMMEVATRLLKDNKRRSYHSELLKRVDQGRQYETVKDTIFLTMNDMASMLVTSDDDGDSDNDDCSRKRSTVRSGRASRGDSSASSNNDDGGRRGRSSKRVGG